MNTRILDARQGKVINPVSELRVKDAMIDWLAKACEELALELCDYPKFQCPKEKQDWINDAEKAVQDAYGK